MIEVQKFFKSFDLIAPAERLYLGNRKKTRTLFGSFLTISAIVLIILATISIGDELFLKEKPSILIQNKFESEAPLLDLSENKFSIAVRLENEYIQPVENMEKYFKLYVYFQYYEKTDTGYNYDYQYLSLVNCTNTKTISDIPDEKDFLSKFSGLYCINETNLTVYGNWNSKKLKYLTIQLDRCKGPNCANSSEIDKMINSYLNLIVYFSDSVINNQNFNNPITKRISFVWSTLSNNNVKKIIVYLKKVIINSDLGFLLTDMKQEESYQFDTKETEQAVNNNILFYAFFYSSSNVEIKTRYYLKVQEVLAQIGGIINFFMVSIKIITYFFKINERDQNLINDYIHFDNEFNKKTKIYESIHKNDTLKSNSIKNKMYKIKTKHKKKSKKEENNNKNLSRESNDFENKEINESNINLKKENKSDKLKNENEKIRDNNEEKKVQLNEEKKNEINLHIINENNENDDENDNNNDIQNTKKQTINNPIKNNYTKEISFDNFLDDSKNDVKKNLKETSNYNKFKNFWLQLYKKTTSMHTFNLNFFEKLFPFNAGLFLNQKKKEKFTKLKKILYQSVDLPQFFKYLIF